MEESASSPSTVWKKLDSPSPFIDMWSAPWLAGGRKVALCKAVATVDCPPLLALAHRAAVCSRVAMRIFGESGDPARLVSRELSQHHLEFAQVRKLQFPFSNRQFLTRHVFWKSGGGDLLAAFEPMPADHSVDYGAAMRAVLGKSGGLVRFTPLPGGESCRATVLQ